MPATQNKKLEMERNIIEKCFKNPESNNLNAFALNQVNLTADRTACFALILCMILSLTSVDASPIASITVF